MNRPDYIFHYTSEFRVNQILESGELKTNRNSLKRKETPTIWLSTQPEWEDSALKCINFKNKEQQHQTIGLGRIVVPFSEQFITYGKWTHASGVQPSLVSQMKASFPNFDRTKWWASFRNIPQAEFLSVEYWDGEQWCNYYEKGTPTEYNGIFLNSYFM